MRFHRKIAFRIWLYFSLAISLLFSGMAWYYSNTQRKLIVDARGKELQEFCRTISLGVEISLAIQDFDKLRKAVDYFKQKGGEYDFLLLTQAGPGQTETIFTHLSLDKNFQPQALDSSQYLIRYYHYSSGIMSGRIISGMAKQKIDQQISSLNTPVYLSALVMFSFSFVLFYFIARSISQPISRAIENAHLLGQNRFNDFSVNVQTGSDEIGLLEQALISLRESLMDQQATNQMLINNLESEVSRRTRSLNEVLERLTEAQETAKLASFTWNPEKEKWVSSENLNGLLGIEKEYKTDYLSVYNRVEESSKKIFTSLFSMAKEKEILQTLPFYHSEEGIRWMNIFCRYIHPETKGKQGYFSGTIQDVTQQKKAEQELERLSLLATNTTNLVLFTDVNKRIIWANESLTKLTGYTREEIYGKTPRIFQTEKTDPLVIAFINKAIEERKAVKAEVLNRGKHGNEYWLELYIQPVFNRQSEQIGYMAIEIDITERKANEEKEKQYVADIKKKQEEINTINSNLEGLVREKTLDLEQSMIRLQNSQEELVRKEKMATLGMLVAGIAHEVNTPLGAIKASAENLNYLLKQSIVKLVHGLTQPDLALSLNLLEISRKNPKLSTQQEREASKKIQDFFSKSSSPDAYPFWLPRMLAQMGFQETETIPDELFHMPQERMKAVLGLAQTLGGIDISVGTIENAALRASKIIRALNVYSHSEESAPHLPFDLHDSLNAVADLLSNKFKQGAVFVNNVKPGTMVMGQEDELSQVWTNLINNALQASNNKCKIVVSATALPDGMLSVELENDGPPIPPEIRERIFDEFFTTKKRGEGTGLGLSIVSRIVSRHNGRVACKSSVGSTIFEVVLPISNG